MPPSQSTRTDLNAAWAAARMAADMIEVVERNLMQTDEITLPVEEIVESNAGDRLYRALTAQVAMGQCEAAHEEFRYSDDPAQQQFAELCRQVAEFDLRL